MGCGLWPGVHDLEVKNRALLGKWLFKLLSEDGVWQTLLRRKYVGDQAVSQVQWKPGDSHFWAGLMATKKFFFPHGSFAIRDGSEIRFWEDKWLGHSTLREQYPALYTIVRNKSDTIAKVLGTSPPDVSFRRSLLGTNKHPGMLCSSDWIPSICRKVQINFYGILRRMINSRLILCIEH